MQLIQEYDEEHPKTYGEHYNKLNRFANIVVCKFFLSSSVIRSFICLSSLR